MPTTDATGYLKSLSDAVKQLIAQTSTLNQQFTALRSQINGLSGEIGRQRPIYDLDKDDWDIIMQRLIAEFKVQIEAQIDRIIVELRAPRPSELDLIRSIESGFVALGNDFYGKIDSYQSECDSPSDCATKKEIRRYPTRQRNLPRKLRQL